MSREDADHLPAALAAEKILTEFERAWRGGEPPELGAFLERAPASRRAWTLSELVALDIEYRWSNEDPGSIERLALEDYVERFPELGGSRLPTELVEVEYRARRAAGERVDLESFLSRFPERVEELRALLSLADARVAAGAQFGRFRLVEQLGSGTFGSVWRAHDDKLQRDVALKIPLEERLDERNVALFLREARAVAALQHANIVPIHDSGRAGESVYLVYDFIDGVDLSQWREQRARSPRDIARIVGTIARALDHAHERGIIHRDVKPSNILVDEGDRPHILDFGLARLDSADQTLTADGALVGTLAYMAPELVRGEGREADRRADVYSLGVVLFELMTGARPFRGSAASILQAIVESPPPRPRKMRRDVPVDLETVCLHCLEKSPGARYASARELAEEFERFLDRVPVLARRAGPLRRASRWVERNPVVSLLLLALAVALVIALWQGGVARESARELREAVELQQKEAYASSIAAAALAAEGDDRAFALAALRSAPQELRGWEWRELARRLSTRRFLFQSGREIAVSPEGHRVAALEAGEPQRCVLRSVDDGSVLTSLELPAGEGEILALALSSGGARLAVARTTDTVVFDARTRQQWRIDGISHRIWFDPQRGTLAILGPHAEEKRFVLRRVRLLDGIPSGAGARPTFEVVETRSWGDLRFAFIVGAGEFSPANPWWVVESASGPRQEIVSGLDGEILARRSMQAHENMTTCTLAGDRSRAAFSIVDRRGPSYRVDVRGSRLASGPLRVELPSEAYSLAFDDPATRLAAGCWDGVVRWIDLETGEIVRELAGHKAPVSALRWLPRSGESGSSRSAGFVSGAHNGAIRLWDASTGTHRRVLGSEEGEVQRIAYSAVGATVFTAAGTGRTASAWDVDDDTVHVFRRHSSYVYAIAIDPRGRVASAGWDSKVRVWDPATGEEPHGPLEHDGTVYSLAFDARGERLAASTDKSTIVVWTLGSTEPPRIRRDVSRASPSPIGFAADGISVPIDWDVDADRVTLWNTVTDAIVDVPVLALRDAGAPYVSPDGASILLQARRRLFNVATYDVISTRDGSRRGTVTTEQPWTVSFTPSGRELVTREATGVVVRDARSLEEIVTLGSHTGAVYAAVFSPDGSRLVTAGRDRVIRLWDTDDYREVAQLRGHSAYVYALRFSPENETLVSASGDHTVRVWRAAPRSSSMDR